jgi:ribonuclease P/MRP protein subunit RPP40
MGDEMANEIQCGQMQSAALGRSKKFTGTLLSEVGGEETTEENNLGIWISNDLKASTHCAKAVGKANQILGLIRRSFTYLDCRLMKQLFTAMVRPHLEYGNVVWHPFLRKDIQLLEGVQHRATRMVPGLSKLTYEERLKVMGLPSLAYRRVRGDAIEAYKYLHGIYKVDCTDIMPLHKDTGFDTRGHCLKLQKRECKGRLRANYFGFRIVNIWNSLPEEVVMADTVNCFKGRFDRLYSGLLRVFR